MERICQIEEDLALRRRKLKLYKALVVPVVLFGCETWKMNNWDEDEVEVFDDKCLRRIIQIQW